MLNPTEQLGQELTQAFEYFNKHLFEDRLPACVILMHRKQKAYGYFCPETWGLAECDDNVVHEIALNPDHLKGRPLDKVLSTLVHEMVHLEQQEFGKPGKGGNHNKEWADMMEKVGLIPSSTGAEGGKRTGKKVSHYIKPGGVFELECLKLMADGFVITYLSQPRAKEGKVNLRPRITYKCPGCDCSAVGKPDLKLRCMDCDEDLIGYEK